METQKLPNRSRLKLTFFAVYALSVLLLFVLLSSFLNIGSSGGGSAAAREEGKPDARLAVDPLLHRQLERLQTATSLYLLKNASPEAAGALRQENANLTSLVDSIRIASASLPATEKQEVLALLDDCSRQADKEVSMVKTAATLNRNVPASGSAASGDLNELKGILVQKEQTIQQLETRNNSALQEKDKTIADLQTKLAAQGSIGTQSKQAAAEGEWKDKYESLKAGYDKLKTANDKTVSESNAMKTAYKEVVDDNRRLLNQLQSSRATKN